jgi:UDP-2,3-diacylglucosamine pyrophosphatase LpxH
MRCPLWLLQMRQMQQMAANMDPAQMAQMQQMAANMDPAQMRQMQQQVGIGHLHSAHLHDMPPPPAQLTSLLT